MTPAVLVEQLGLGGIFGAIVGYTAKKATKLMAIVLGAAFILIQVLAYYNLVTPHWERIGDVTEGLAGSGGGSRLHALMSILTANLPFAGSFMVGFLWGFRMG